MIPLWKEKRRMTVNKNLLSLFCRFNDYLTASFKSSRKDFWRTGCTSDSKSSWFSAQGLKRIDIQSNIKNIIGTTKVDPFLSRSCTFWHRRWKCTARSSRRSGSFCRSTKFWIYWNALTVKNTVVLTVVPSLELCMVEGVPFSSKFCRSSSSGRYCREDIPCCSLSSLYAQVFQGNHSPSTFSSWVQSSVF